MKKGQKKIETTVKSWTSEK